MKILQHDETETGPRIRKTLTDLHGIDCVHERDDIGGVRTEEWTLPDIDLYRYTRPSTGEDMWIVEARIFFPPDVELFRGWVVDERPDDEQVREIVTRNMQKDSVLQ